MSWEPINQAFVHGILLGYEVWYTKDDGSPLTWASETLDPNTHEITLDHLEYFTRYKVVVCAKTSKGCGESYTAISYTWGDGEFMTLDIWLQMTFDAQNFFEESYLLLKNEFEPLAILAEIKIHE